MIDLVNEMVISLINNYKNNKQKLFYYLNYLANQCKKTIVIKLKISVEIKANLLDKCFYCINASKKHLLKYPLNELKPSKNCNLKPFKNKCNKCNRNNQDFLITIKKGKKSLEYCFDCCKQNFKQLFKHSGYWFKFFSEFEKL